MLHHRTHVCIFFTKALQGALFIKFGDLIMGWKNIDKLWMVPPSTKERVGNVVKVGSNKEETKSIIDTQGEIIESILETGGERTGYNV